LEIFFFTVVAVLGTLYLLQRQDINFDIQLQPKILGEADYFSFVSFAPRAPLQGLATTKSGFVHEPSQFEYSAVGVWLGDANGSSQSQKWSVPTHTLEIN
jgi:hypothetical protein